jgi:hypothetical protein
MTRARKIWASAVLVTAVAIYLSMSACAPLKSYRPEPQCKPGSGGAPDCHESYVEEKDDYKLYFSEYDDQGFSFDPEQQKTIVDSLRHEIVESEEQFSIVTFVHGWKHTARDDDSNVIAFRNFLHALATEESNSCHRKVRGIYIGWRGAALELGDLVEDTTFWNRKAAAGRVAQGSVRHLLANLRDIEDQRNRNWWAKTKDAASEPDFEGMQGWTADLCLRKPVRSVTVGHSFGGLIVYTSLAESLIERILALHAYVGQRPSPERDRELAMLKGDLVVLINPAIEAARFNPLHEAADQHRFSRYQPPMFVSVTSRDDDATRMFFPLGQRLGSPAAIHANDAESRAARQTIGHDADYVSYELVAADSYLGRAETAEYNAMTRPIVEDRGGGPVEANPQCASWTNWLRLGSDENRRQAELNNLCQWGKSSVCGQFNANLTQSINGNLFPREFCSMAAYDEKENPQRFGGLYLFPAKAGAKLAKGDAAKDGEQAEAPDLNLNSPIWNVVTEKPIVNDHGDIENPRLWVFLRQLYEEGDMTVGSYKLGVAPGEDGPHS